MSYFWVLSVLIILQTNCQPVQKENVANKAREERQLYKSFTSNPQFHRAFDSATPDESLVTKFLRKDGYNFEWPLLIDDEDYPDYDEYDKNDNSGESDRYNEENKGVVINVDDDYLVETNKNLEKNIKSSNVSLEENSVEENISKLKKPILRDTFFNNSVKIYTNKKSKDNSTSKQKEVNVINVKIIPKVPQSTNKDNFQKNSSVSSIIKEINNTTNVTEYNTTKDNIGSVPEISDLLLSKKLFTSLQHKLNLPNISEIPLESVSTKTNVTNITTGIKMDLNKEEVENFIPDNILRKVNKNIDNLLKATSSTKSMLYLSKAIKQIKEKNKHKSKSIIRKKQINSASAPKLLTRFRHKAIRNDSSNLMISNTSHNSNASWILTNNSDNVIPNWASILLEKLVSYFVQKSLLSYNDQNDGYVNTPKTNIRSMFVTLRGDIKNRKNSRFGIVKSRSRNKNLKRNRKLSNV